MYAVHLIFVNKFALAIENRRPGFSSAPPSSPLLSFSLSLFIATIIAPFSIHTGIWDMRDCAHITRSNENADDR